jgi:cell division septation protein DedD
MRSWQERTFDMRALRRLAIWGGAATMALVMAVVASYSDTGSRRAVVASAGPGNAQPGNAQKTDARGARLDARSPDMEAETKRLADAVRVLTADREQLIARIGTLERKLEDITGAIKRQDTRQDPPAASLPALSPVSPAAPSASNPPAPKEANAGPQPQLSAPERIANAPAATPEEAPSAELAKGEFAVDIGGAASFEGLRTLWASTKATNGALFEALFPAVAVRENSRAKSAELRLIVGPLPDVEAAARLCAKLSSTRRYCQPVAFEGQRLAEADMGPEQRTPGTPKPPIRPGSRPAAKSSSPTAKFPRLF